MKRKIFNLSLLVMTVVAMVGCRQVPFSEYSTLADWTWVYSGDYSDSDQYEYMQITAGDNISFMDCSAGYIDHKWIVPTNSGIYFLSEEPSSSDEFEDLSFVANANYVTAEPTIHLYFKDWSAETYGIRMVNTYNKAVKYIWQVSNINYEATSTYKDGVHVADTTFKVRVYSEYMTPQARVFRARAEKGATKISHGFTDPDDIALYGYDENKVYDDPDWEYTYAGEIFYKGVDGVALPYVDGSDNSATTVTYDSSLVTDVEVMYGQSLYFVDTSYDTPNTWTWTNIKSSVTYHSIENVTEPEMQFVTMTTRSANGTAQSATTFDAIKLKVERTSEDGIMPTSKNKTVTLPISVVVNGSVYEPELTAELVDGNVQLTISNAAFEYYSGDSGSLHSGLFFAMYKNDYDDSLHTGIDHSGSPLTGVVTFSSSEITYDSAYPNVITLTPNSPLYNTDEIALFWTSDLPLLNNEMASFSKNNGSYTSSSGYSETAFESGHHVISTELIVAQDFYYDFETAFGQDYSAGDIEWTVINGTTGQRTDIQPVIEDSPISTDSGNKVLKIYVPPYDSNKSQTDLYYLIAGGKFKGIGGEQKTVNLYYDMYYENVTYGTTSYDETKHCSKTSANYANWYIRVVPSNATESDVASITTLDPVNNSYVYKYTFRGDSYATTTDGSNGAWLCILSDGVNNPQFYHNGNPTADTWLNGPYQSNAYTGARGYGLYTCDPDDDDDYLIMSVFLQCQGTFYLDNFSYRTVDVRPNE